MVTTKRRLNITLTSEMDNLIKEMSKRDQVPEATKVTELLRNSLILEEDKALSLLAEARLQQPSKKISHETIWAT